MARRVRIVYPAGQFVVTVAAGGTPELFGPFPSRDKASAFARKVCRDRRRDEAIPAVSVQPVKPGRMSAVRL
ncbi:hypothetical protein ABH926_008937 [Catenulispora sp. GP43]|uniref:hypothetical protein n=1 Tax=Catenulispora sp. GP43 TaxID=3156263 RepID=UPI0035165BD7